MNQRKDTWMQNKAFRFLEAHKEHSNTWTFCSLKSTYNPLVYVYAYIL